MTNNPDTDYCGWNEEPDSDAIERVAFEAFIMEPYRAQSEACPHSFRRSETGSAYAAPYLNDAYASFAAGYRAALAKPPFTPVGDDVELRETLLAIGEEKMYNAPATTYAAIQRAATRLQQLSAEVSRKDKLVSQILDRAVRLRQGTVDWFELTEIEQMALAALSRPNEGDR